MAIEVRQKTCVVPAGTSINAPLTFDLSFPQRRVDTLQFIVPPGPSGVVGFYIANALTQVIPYDKGEWIVTSDEKTTWPLEGFPTSGSWQLVAYNTGSQDHTVYVRFLCSLPSSPQVAIATGVLDDSTIDGTAANLPITTPGVPIG